MLVDKPAALVPKPIKASLLKLCTCTAFKPTKSWLTMPATCTLLSADKVSELKLANALGFKKTTLVPNQVTSDALKPTALVPKASKTEELMC